MAKTLCRMSLAILLVKMANLLGPHPVAILISVVVILHSDERDILRQVARFINRAAPPFLGGVFSFLGTSPSYRRISRGWRFFLLLMILPTRVLAGVAGASRTETVSLPQESGEAERVAGSSSKSFFAIILQHLCKRRVESDVV